MGEDCSFTEPGRTGWLQRAYKLAMIEVELLHTRNCWIRFGLTSAGKMKLHVLGALSAAFSGLTFHM